MAQGLHDTKAMRAFKLLRAARVFFLEPEPVEKCSDIDGGAGVESGGGGDPTFETFEQFFHKLDECAAKSLECAVRNLPSRDDSILQRCRSLRDIVRSKYPSWSDFEVRIACGALIMYRVRMVDIFTRELAFLLWTIEGDVHMRAHNGFCFMYHEQGCYQPYSGIPPESTFVRVKRFLLVLEGLFRSIPTTTPRTDERVLEAVADVLSPEETESAEEVFSHLVDAATLSHHPSKRRKVQQRPFEGAQSDEERAANEEAHGWTQQIAHALSKIGLQLQSALLDERKLLGYIIEWCDSPPQKTPGCCYIDCCVLYDVGPGEHLKFVPRGPDNNIFVRIPHKLLDPVLESAKQQLEAFFKTTFWENISVFVCCQAAQALAKRGENIDRCFIGVGPGGVGQSLYSHLLSNMYGHNHAYVDPNVWFHEDELRKQIEQFAHCFIFTGQEAPQGYRKVREDLYKKTMSANGIAGRRPYGTITRMLSLVGWKRLEVNHMFNFQGVTEENFNSLLRRSLVWRPRARFVEKHQISESSEQEGIFLANPSLREFLMSGPAVAAALAQQHAFEALHGRDECRETIENYVCKEDAGLTEQVMREACCLNVEKGYDDEKLGKVRSELEGQLLQQITFALTLRTFKRMPLVQGRPADREEQWKLLLQQGALVESHIQDSFFLKVATSVPLTEVCRVNDVRSPTLWEQWHIHNLRSSSVLFSPLILICVVSCRVIHVSFFRVLTEVLCRPQGPPT